MEAQGVEIIMIEDNKGDAELTQRALKKYHLANHLIHLKDGVEALDFIFGTNQFAGRDIHVLPRVILLDLNLPKLGGLKVLERLKSDPLTKHIPVVILTSSAEDPDVKRAYTLGANSYIVKPVEFKNFSKAVADLGMYWMVINKANT